LGTTKEKEAVAQGRLLFDECRWAGNLSRDTGTHVETERKKHVVGGVGERGRGGKALHERTICGK